MVVALAGALVGASAVTHGCGEPFNVQVCTAHQYSVIPPSGSSLTAVLNPTESGQQEFLFTPPSMLVEPGVIDLDDGVETDAEVRLHLRLADATRELCRRTLEIDGDVADVRDANTNCDSFTADSIVVQQTEIQPSNPDPTGPHIQDDPKCTTACLQDPCYNYFGDPNMWDPNVVEHPFVRAVRCHCEIERVGTCPGPDRIGPTVKTIEEDFCLPEPATGPDPEVGPADFCRESIADYLAAGIRTIGHFQGIHLTPDGTCGEWGSDSIDVQVECRPVATLGRTVTQHGAEAYAHREVECLPGCSSADCWELELGAQDCDAEVVVITAGCDNPGDCIISDDCDCDQLVGPCFDGPVVDAVCLPEPGAPTPGLDDGDDDGGSGTDRLKSAITLLTGEWRNLGAYTCSELDATDGVAPGETDPPAPGLKSGYAVANGTRFTTGLQHTCPTPTTQVIGPSLYGASLAELCRAIPLCETTQELELLVTATEGGNAIGSATLTKDGDAIVTSEAGAPLPVGEHVVQLCVEHPPSGVSACVDQPILASSPLGSGIDGFGNFAGEVAGEFIPIASRLGSTELVIGPDGLAEVVLPRGFRFRFYDRLIRQRLWVGENGGINFDPIPIGPANTALPAATGSPAPALAPFWDDLDLTSGGEVHTWFDGVRFIVSWEDVAHGRDGADSGGAVSFQVHIYADSRRIEFHYDDTDVGDPDYDDGASATIGMANPAGGDAVLVSHDDRSLLLSGAAGIRIDHASFGCTASEIRLPPEVACTAPDAFATVCRPRGSSVVLEVPDVSACALGAQSVQGHVVASGQRPGALRPLTSPIQVVNGVAELSPGVHEVQWRPVTADGQPAAPTFTQLVFVRTWQHADCPPRTRFVLGPDDDVFVAPASSDALEIEGMEGQDTIVAATEDDLVCEGDEAGISELGHGDDVAVCEAGDDTVDGGDGNDEAAGGLGDDLLVGGPGDDRLHGHEGNDLLFGDDDDDSLWGGTGDDVLEGGDGDDDLVPGAGVDVADGGDGDDTIVILHACELTEGKHLSGGDGADTLLLPAGVDLAAVAAAGVVVDADIEAIGVAPDLPLQVACVQGAAP